MYSSFVSTILMTTPIIHCRSNAHKDLLQQFLNAQRSSKWTINHNINNLNKHLQINVVVVIIDLLTGGNTPDNYAKRKELF